ncbi:hypothetical protein [Shewanella sp. HL-SH2]|uniref:hypothetical protein n=1 Tax=Shewanella sp. HL-SH2 TaxID=3436238 RepID=UPI003EBF0C92
MSSAHLIFATALRFIRVVQILKGKRAEIARNIIDAMALITLDALHCQVSTTNKIRQINDDFVIQLKSTQPRLFEAVKTKFSEAYE